MNIIATRTDAGLDPLLSGGYASDKAAALKEASFDCDAIAAEGLRYERLDQLLVEHLMGVRS